MKLRSLKIRSRESTGWESEELLFGNTVTQLYGPNGCGKTPIIQSIAYALGYPAKFRDDIYLNCKSVLLGIEHNGHMLTLCRTFDNQFDVQVQDANGDTSTYYSEKEYSTFLFEKLEIDNPKLTSVSNDPTQPYMSTLLPLFYLDQDLGYTSMYKSPVSFIKDQFAEMVRLAFNISPKNSFDKKKLLIEKKRKLDQLDRATVNKRKLIEELQRDVPSPRRSGEDIDAEVTILKSQLEELKDSRSHKDQAESIVESLMYERHASAKDTSREIDELQARISGFTRIKDEIELEVNTLSLNEEARRLFVSFQDICANPSCDLFLASSESYGKNLLYLRDQIKDLQRNSDSFERRVGELEQDLESTLQEIESLRIQMANIGVGDEIESLINATSEITRRLVDLQRDRQIIQELDEEENDYVHVLNEREIIQNDIGSLSGSSDSGDLRVIEVRSALRERIPYWMDVLRTRNVSREIKVDSEFGIQFGSEQVSQFKGSTLLRIVLAFHAALFELYTNEPGNKLRFMLLDTPRQQDLDSSDFGNYLHKLRECAASRGTQIIFSTTEYHYETQKGDMEWTPQFSGNEQNMFLGTLEA